MNFTTKILPCSSLTTTDYFVTFIYKNKWGHLLTYLLFLNLTETLTMTPKHLSHIQRFASTFTIQDGIPEIKLTPDTEQFYKPESSKTLFRSWQRNPEIGATCYTISRYLTIEKILVEPTARNFYQSYRAYLTFMSFTDCQLVRDEILKLCEKYQYKLYGNTSQIEMEFN